MKKIHYLLAFVVAAAAFSACKPLSKTYDELGDVPKPVTPIVIPATVASYTLVAADYSTLPASNPANLQLFFHGSTDAFASIPTILTKKYPGVGDKSTVTVTYATSPAIPNTFRVADSLNADDAYTLISPTDYLLLPGNTFTDFSTAQAITWLPIKFPTAVNGTLKDLTYNYFESGKTTNSGTLQTDAYLMLNSAWQKIYRISNAQYASVGNGVNNWFVAADVPNLPAYFNQFLKADPTVMLTAQVGTVIYVNYRYLTTYQKVMALAYDGANWIATPTTATNTFSYSLATNTWTGQLDNTASYTLVSANYTTISNMTTTTLGPTSTTAAIGNLAAHGNFAIAAGSAVTTATDDGVRWTDAALTTGVAAVLKTQFPSALTNQRFNVTVSVYGGYSTLVFAFVYDGANFVYKPVPDAAKYTLTGDDITAIARANIGTAAASLNLNQYGDFASSWTQANIDAGNNLILKTRYPNATANQAVVVTYPIYSGGNVIVTKSYKFDGTNWN